MLFRVMWVLRRSGSLCVVSAFMITMRMDANNGRNGSKLWNGSLNKMD